MCKHFKCRDVMYRWEDEKEDEERFTEVAIGEFDEDCEDCQSKDHDIFYFFEDEKEFNEALNKPYGDGFIIRELVNGH